MIFSSRHLLPKTNELYYYETSGRLVFVHFLEEIEATKKTFRNYLTFSRFVLEMGQIFVIYKFHPQHDGVRTTYYEKRYTKNSFKIHFWDAHTLQSRTGPVQGQNRGSQVMATGFSLFGKVHRENPVLITGMGLQCRYSGWALELDLP